MLSYYSYYSMGGYKDMFLGNAGMMEKDVFFLPLLAVWKKRAESNQDEALMEKVRTLSELPSIRLLNQSESYGLPVEADRVFSHGGYKVMYVAYKSGETLLAIRDIEGEEKDEAGRAIPFLIVLAGTTSDDRRTLGRLAAYMASNLTTTGRKLSSLFEYDPEKNGLCFHLGVLNDWVQNTAASASAVIQTLHGECEIDPGQDNAAWIIVPDGLNLKLAVEEQGLQAMKVTGVPQGEVFPQDDAKRMLALVRSMLADRQGKSAKKWIPWSSFATGFILGFIAGFFCGWKAK